MYVRVKRTACVELDIKFCVLKFGAGRCTN
jgi:hypothetical protein